MAFWQKNGKNTAFWQNHGLHSIFAWWCTGEGIGLVINMLHVQLPAEHCRVSTWMGDRLCNQSPSLPSLRGR